MTFEIKLLVMHVTGNISSKQTFYDMFAVYRALDKLAISSAFERTLIYLSYINVLCAFLVEGPCN